MSARRLDASALRDWAHTAVGDLISHTDEINRLNVFPVADADTGTNMLFTMRSAWAQADTQSGTGDVAQVAAALAGGALHGARGNSGVILSQILRGLADVTAAAAADAAARPYPKSTDPSSGPLCVTPSAWSSRRWANRCLARSSRCCKMRRVAAEHTAADGADLADVVFAAADAAAVALDKTTEQLDVLAEAGVVDAGGRGLLVLLDAMTHDPGRARSAPARVPAVAAAASRSTRAPHAAPQFEVMYLLSGCDPDGVEKLRERLDQLGESVAIAASARRRRPLFGARARR